MKKKSSHQGKLARNGNSPFAAESLENRTLFSALPTVKLVATVPTASGITGANGQFKVSRTGSTASPLKVYYHALSSSTINPHQYTKLAGEVTIHGGESITYIDVKPVIGLTVSTDPTLSVVVTQNKAYSASTHSATVTVTENNGGTTVSGQRYYVPITVAANGFTRTDQPVNDSINLTSALSSLNGSGAIEDSSLVVEETDSSGNVIDTNVPFQFDKGSGYDATSNASGNLVLEMKGTTTSSQTRYYRLYFDTQGTYTTPTFTSQVAVSDATDTIGDDSWKITTNEATWTMEKDSGAFSSVVDKQGNDWVSYNNTSGPDGTYRGVANMGVSNGTHPGQSTGSTTVVSSGPLKTVIDYTSTDSNEMVQWTFYANFAQCTVLESNNGPYWVVYEGTPGGTFNANDQVVQSDGTSTALSGDFNDANGIGNGNSDGQWAYFDSTSENRILYLAQNTQDSNPDVYWPYNDGSGSGMTVFGFGRDIGDGAAPEGFGGATEHLTAVNTFTIGLAEDSGNSFSTASTTINGQYRDVTVNTGSAAASS
jgi:hypothetical protein